MLLFTAERRKFTQKYDSLAKQLFEKPPAEDEGAEEEVKEASVKEAVGAKPAAGNEDAEEEDKEAPFKEQLRVRIACVPFVTLQILSCSHRCASPGVDFFEGGSRWQPGKDDFAEAKMCSLCRSSTGMCAGDPSAC